MADEATPAPADTADAPTPPDASGGDTPDPAAEAEKWKALARKHESQAKANADAAKRLQELEDAQKSESEKLSEALAAAKREAEEAKTALLRSQVAQETGLPPVLANRLTGSTKEELEADAKALLEAFPQTPSNGKPKENLRPGGDSDDTPTVDPKKLAESIWSSNQY